MAAYRETPCKFYLAVGQCAKGREAKHTGYCQRCGKYQPRAKVRAVNRKKQKLEKLRKKDYRL